MSIGTTAIELRVFKKKKKKKEKKNMDMGNTLSQGMVVPCSYIVYRDCIGCFPIRIWCSFTEIFGILFSFHILSAIQLLKVKMT